MSLAQVSIKRPVFTTMITLIVLILGGVSLSRLRIDLLPSIELPTLSIRTQYEGASPLIMERLITQIIEEIVGTVPGVVEISSQSSEGNSNIMVNFSWGTDIDTAALDVQATLEAEKNELPSSIDPPRISKFDIDSSPVVVLGISSPLDPVAFTELIEEQIRYRFARLSGVAQVDLWGGFTREVRVEIIPERLYGLGLSLDQILKTLRDANLDLPAGDIEQGRFKVTLRAPGEFISLDQIRKTVLVTRQGAAITLDQVAKVVDTTVKPTRIIRVNGQSGLRVAIRKQADANTVEVAQQVQAEVEASNRAFPQLHIVPVINQGNFIERSIANVANSVFYGGGISALVLLFFLRDLRSTLVISLAIPISLLATFALLYFAGLSLNLMTLGGLALGVGMMVDCSIVVLENIVRRHHENQESPQVAAIEGTREVASAVIASTITTLVIFMPLIFVHGITSILFRELAIVIIFSLSASLLVSLSLVPVLAARMMRSAEDRPVNRGGWMERMAWRSDKMFRNMEHQYRDLLYWVLRHRWGTLFFALAIFAGSLFLLPLIGTEFLPPSDEGEVRVTGDMEIGTRLDLVDEQTQKMEKMIYAAIPEKIASVVTVGRSGRNVAAAAQGHVQISLTPATQRDRSNVEIAHEVRKRLAGQIPGMSIRTRAPQGQFLLERLLATEEGISVEVRGFELDILDGLAGQIVKSIADIPGITDVKPSREAGIPQQEFLFNRDKIYDVGLTVRQVSEALKTAMAGSKASEYRLHGNAYRIFVQLEKAEKRRLEDILNLTLTTPTGEQVVLRHFVTPVWGEGPLVIDRKDQQRLVTVQANVAGRDLGSVAGEVQARLDQIPRPSGYQLIAAGQFEEQQKSFRELLISLLLSLILVYMVLAAQYESLRDPVVVMVSVPLAAIGVLLMLFLSKTTLNLQSYIGCIMLGGIVVNNAILLVDQASQLRGTGMGVYDAVAEAGRRRLRPILMTTLTTILAMLPLAFGIGEGADAQAPLARTVVGGLSASTLITLVLIPVVYSLFHSESKS
ncbi:MAG: efflux RND transporter permease subunit [Magnetococcus sp. DMHC-6]